MLAIRGAVLYNFGSVQLQSYWTIMGRMDQFLMGMVAGVLLRTQVEPTKRGRLIATVLGLVGFVAILAFFKWWHRYAGGFQGDLGPGWGPRQNIWAIIPTIEAVCYAAMVAGYVSFPLRGGIMVLTQVSSGTAYLGRISYSIFMNQFFVLTFMREATKHWQPKTWQEGALQTLFVALPILTLVSTATYFLIEKPFLDLKDQRKSRP
jgi:peptidoglycan/LPS O-acetylase OafA/YrhL